MCTDFNTFTSSCACLPTSLPITWIKTQKSLLIANVVSTSQRQIPKEPKEEMNVHWKTLIGEEELRCQTKNKYFWNSMSHWVYFLNFFWSNLLLSIPCATIVVQASNFLSKLFWQFLIELTHVWPLSYPNLISAPYIIHWLKTFQWLYTFCWIKSNLLLWLTRLSGPFLIYWPHLTGFLEYSYYFKL